MNIPDRELFAPASVAVIGASDDPGRIGGKPIRYMLERGFAGRILPVNPGRRTVQGLPAYAAVADLPETPEVAIIAVPPAAAVAAVSDLAARGTAAAILFTSGFAEGGAAGAALQDRLVAAARAGGMRLVGPNCLGMFSTASGFYGTFSTMLETGFPVDGPLGIISQSGAFGSHIIYSAREAGIGVGAGVTTGNEADLTLGHIIMAMVRRPSIEVIAIYSEGLRDADTLLPAFAEARAAKKPLVMVKVGRSALGAAAAMSHTASIANDDAVIDAVLAEYGVARARTAEELLDIAALATRRIYPAANSLGVFTISGGAGVLVSDTAERLGLPMPPMPEAAQQRLKTLLPISSPRNPVDMTAQFINDPPLFSAFVELLVADGGYRSILGFLSYTGSVPGLAERLRDELDAIRTRHPGRLFVLSALGPPEMKALYEEKGFAVFSDPTRAAVAIAAMGGFGRAFAEGPRLPPPEIPLPELPATSPDEAGAAALLAAAGIPFPEQRICRTADAAEAAAAAIGFPVVMKILSADIAHKSDIGGVLVGVGDRDAARAGFDLLLARAAAAAPAARLGGVLVARQVAGGTECIIGIQQDPVFGPIALFGLGGVFVELIGDVALRRCPFGEDVAAEMIGSVRGAALLKGARGRPPADVAALARMLARVSAFAAAAGPRLRSLDLNPVVATADGAFALDAMLELAAPADPDHPAAAAEAGLAAAAALH